MAEPALPAGVFARMVALRRDLHRHPELSFEEERTACQIAAALRELGLEPRRIAGTGLVVDLPGVGDGARVALRADTDALPIQETTGLPFGSETAGIMHACGHDGHSSMLLGAAALLVQGPPPPAPVRLLWQPAEEQGAGALALIEAGALEGVGAIFGGHLDPRLPTGTLVCDDGPMNASSDTFRVEVLGQAGHGARPHEARDALVIGSQLVVALQTVVSRELDPGQAAALSVGRFQAGSAPNVIAGRALLEGTLRAQSPEVRAQLLAALERIVKGTAAASGARLELEVQRGTPPVVNAPASAALGRQAARDVGAEVVPLPTANLGGEDFACYLERVPGCYVRYGARPTARAWAPAHSGGFDFDEAALAIGARWLARVAAVAGATLG
ncbi:MAG: M20 family metallopeptidase [Planctomycetota bacterium]